MPSQTFGVEDVKWLGEGSLGKIRGENKKLGGVCKPYCF
jgi:hypothetical protein